MGTSSKSTLPNLLWDLPDLNVCGNNDHQSFPPFSNKLWRILHFSVTSTKVFSFNSFGRNLCELTVIQTSTVPQHPEQNCCSPKWVFTVLEDGMSIPEQSYQFKTPNCSKKCNLQAQYPIQWMTNWLKSWQR